MHNNLQGGEGMCNDLQLWLENGNLGALINRLKKDGFTVFMTADHGNTTAIGQGPFKGSSVIMENASRRALIYKADAGVDSLDKYDLTEYNGAYMPPGYRYFAFAPHACYGTRGT